jgi:hypothetical protein
MGYTINDSDTRHNGWTNYATWRVNLEIFDGMDIRDDFGDDLPDTHALADWLEKFADDTITNLGADDGLAVDYARAFLADVNWREIADHLLDAARANAEV